MTGEDREARIAALAAKADWLIECVKVLAADVGIELDPLPEAKK